MVTLWIIMTSLFLVGMFYLSYLAKNKDKFTSEVYHLISPVMVQIEYDLLLCINEYRKLKGKRTLCGDKLCRELAEEHVRFMVDNKTASHNYFIRRADELLYQGAHSVGECVGYGYNSAEGFLRGYVNSLKHEPVILGNFTHVGVRCLKDANDRYYNALIFIKV